MVLYRSALLLPLYIVLQHLNTTFMRQNFTTDELSRWILRFNNNKTLPFITKSGLIKLDDLEAFVAEIKKQKADSVRIYFLRFSLDDAPTAKKLAPDGKLAKGCKWLEAGNRITQATIAMVPAKNFKIDEDDLVFSANDIILDNHIHTLIPGIDDTGTGLNPPGPSAVTNVIE